MKIIRILWLEIRSNLIDDIIDLKVQDSLFYLALKDQKICTTNERRYCFEVFQSDIEILIIHNDVDWI